MARTIAIDTVSTYYDTLNARDASRDPGATAVLEVLSSETGEGFLVKQIAEQGQLPEATVGKVLKRLTGSGIVEATGNASRRRYSLTPEAELLRRD